MNKNHNFTEEEVREISNIVQERIICHCRSRHDFDSFFVNNHIGECVE